MNKPKVFVSSTIYDFKDLRSALKYWLAEKGYEVRKSLQIYIEKELLKDEILKSKEEQLKLITKQSSSIIKDAEIIFDFIKEVTKVDEMKKAVQLGENYPQRNWINQFENFEDIINVLKMELCEGMCSHYVSAP